MTQKALFIGISYKGTSGALNGCIKDQENLYEFVKSKNPHVEVRVLVDNSTHLPVFGLPTKQNILQGIKWLVQDASANSRLWISYSGHGSWTWDNSKNSEEVDRRDETIVPCDYEQSGQILDDELKRILVDVLPEKSRLTAIFDSCHSGTVLDLPHNFLDESVCKLSKVKTYHPQDWDKVTKYEHHVRCNPSNADVCCWSGCRDIQTSADAYIQGNYSGAMTHAFLQFNSPKYPSYSLRPSSEPRKLSIVLQDMNNWMRINGYTQRPQLSLGKNPDVDIEWDAFSV